MMMVCVWIVVNFLTLLFASRLEMNLIVWRGTELLTPRLRPWQSHPSAHRGGMNVVKQYVVEIEC